MSLAGSRMSVDGAHSLTHSILINLFIKPGLNNFLLPPLLSINFFPRVSSLQLFFDEGGLERRIFVPDKSRAWVRTPWRMKSAILVLCEFLS